MEDIKIYIDKHKINDEKSSDFLDYLYKLIDERHYKKDSDFYKLADISRAQWNSLKSQKHQPSLNTVLKLVFALKANNHECKYLLKKAGYTLASSSDYALIIRYCIENKIYDIDKVNEYLVKYGFTDQLII